MKPEHEPKDIVNYYLQKKREGMDYTQIRKELKEQEFEEAEIKNIVQDIDDKILQEEFEKTSKNTSAIMQTGGWVFTIIGLIFIIGRYTSLTPVDNNLLTYGFLLIGLILLFYGYIKTKSGKGNEKNPASFNKFSR